MRVLAILITVILFGLVRPVLAEQSAFHAPNGVALQGYDTVAYFTRHEATRGHSDKKIMWKGAIWYFASTENLQRFEANPRAYAPRYGGHCAYGVSRGLLVSGDPLNWQIVGGRLYVMHDERILQEWSQESEANIQKANLNWPALYKR
ncbi:MAG: YHS domain-containing (seleno)protein [Heliomarina sp.]|uniref:YHS domain-containing (seleno)protein n=1 Tax=Heliomarina sp. TaxID=2917556 RepID=UPI0040588DC2